MTAFIPLLTITVVGQCVSKKHTHRRLHIFGPVLALVFASTSLGLVYLLSWVSWSLLFLSPRARIFKLCG